MTLREKLILAVTDRSMAGAIEISQPDVFGKYVHGLVDAILRESQLQEIARLEKELAILKDAFILVDGSFTNYSPEQLNTIKRAKELANDDN
jgi:hypothetical protein